MKKVTALMLFTIVSCYGCGGSNSQPANNEPSGFDPSNFNGTFTLDQNNCTDGDLKKIRITENASMTFVTIIDPGTVAGAQSGDIGTLNVAIDSGIPVLETNDHACEFGFVATDAQAAKISSVTLLNVSKYQLFYICSDDPQRPGGICDGIYNKD